MEMGQDPIYNSNCSYLIQMNASYVQNFGFDYTSRIVREKSSQTPR